MLGLVIFSHWLLDLIVHVPNLPILPGNIGNLPYLGFGLWQYPKACIVLEALIVLIGIIFYVRHLYLSSRKTWSSHVLIKSGLMVVFLVGMFVFGI
ncbi:hypothetical protein MTP04_31750 [Lysinibacillus sp. PLM2]|nr:hypothetical protein MTP04_31750 [Lysinibacillus sp. PLM2]